MQAQGYQTDFEAERKDREVAHSKIADVEIRSKHELDTMAKEMQNKSRELDVSTCSSTCT